MSTSQLIATLALVIPSGTALLVAYWHRKQARQLEAFRRDPTVGLDPPPSVLWVHLRKNWQLWQIILGIGIQVGCLVAALRTAEPITRGTIVTLSVIIGGIMFNLVTGSILLVQRRISESFRQISDVVETQGRIIETQGRIISIIDKQAETIKLIGDIAELREQLVTLGK